MSETEAMEFFERLARAIRVIYPRLRRTTAVAIVSNGSRRRVVGCCVCGATMSMCADWPETARVGAFRYEHDKRCGRKIIERAERRERRRALRERSAS